MAELKVVRWKRFGHDRLYVNLPDGTAVGWADCKTGAITILVVGYRAEVLAMLKGRLPDVDHARSPEPVQSPEPVRLPPLTPADDLAATSPGANLQPRLAESDPGLLKRTLAWLLRRPVDGDSWRKGIAGERRVGSELSRLERQGWRVLHSIPLPHDVDVDHLLIGTGGVFSINTKHYPEKSVWVGDDVVKVNRGRPVPHVRKSRSEAARVQRVLERCCDFPVPVEPVLVFVGVTDLKVVATQLKVRVYREREVSALAPLSGVFTADQVEEIYRIARHRQAWVAA
ncbi:nuclease-related domain-containing protein [Streptomyces sp. NPDC019396]|uniref:nuclease-related domain-containing protein n=1 Tax=Streptomyces sp. NPDC019396 TaxID=3154687 RepID=UPI0033C3D52F